MRTISFALALSTTSLSFALSGPIQAQEPSPAAIAATEMLNGLQVLGDPSAIADLKLIREQLKALDTLRGDFLMMDAERLRPLEDLPPDERARKTETIRLELVAETQKRLAEILTPEQLARHRQIMLQRRGYAAFLDPEIQQTLAFDDDQKARLAAIRKEVLDFSQRLREAKGEERRAVLAKALEIRQKALSDALALLSEDQKAQWFKLVGPEFKSPAFSPPPRIPARP